MKKAVIGFLMATASVMAMAQMTPVGVWKTIDDDGKTEKSIVRITETGGAVNGKIEKIFDATKADEKCIKCDGAKKDQPIVGMQIITSVKKDPEESAIWNGGEILDPANGKTYRVRLKPVDGGKKLEVRGYIGTPMLGRTQTWVRAE